MIFALRTLERAISIIKSDVGWESHDGEKICKNFKEGFFEFPRGKVYPCRRGEAGEKKI